MKNHRLTTLAAGLPPAYLANGLVGLRVGPVPLPRGTALVNGFVGLSPELATEQYAEAPYPVGAAYATEFAGEGLQLRRRNDYGHEQDLELTGYHVDAQPGQRYVLRQCGAPRATLEVCS